MNRLVPLLAAVLIMGMLQHLHAQEQLPAPLELEPTPFKLTCQYGSTENGGVERCSFVPDPKVSDCPAGQSRICIRRYGTRTCDCYPD
jgi:hypothetical protein